MKRNHFDLEAARAGAPVCTREGKPVRILCSDMNSFTGRSILALVKLTEVGEIATGYYPDGTFMSAGKSGMDLMMKDKHFRPMKLKHPVVEPVWDKESTFNLKEAKKGARVTTRDRKRVRIVCFDAQTSDGKKIVAIVEQERYGNIISEDHYEFFEDGRYYIVKSCRDLITPDVI